MSLAPILAECARAYGAAFIPASATIHGNAKLEQPMLDLVRTLGGTDADFVALSNARLVSLYSIARKAPDAARRKLAEYRGNAQAAPTAPAATPYDDSALVTALAALTDRINELELAALATPRPVTVSIPQRPDITFASAHPQLPLALQFAAARLPVWLCGPRGSGKSTAARQIAKAFGVPFHVMTGCDDQFALIGYIQPHDGTVVKTAFRLAYEFGGTILLDEFDSYNPAAVIVMNDALANEECAFPDGLIKMHPDFICIAGTNTDGRGPDNQYSGRSVIDSATRDRFAFIAWDYAPGMEASLGAAAPNWTRYVQAVRAEMESQAIDETPSPRATINGAAMITAGVAWDIVAEAFIWRGMSRDIVERISRKVPIADYQTPATHAAIAA